MISSTEITDDLNFVSLFNKEKYSNNTAIPSSFNGCIAHASEITSAARVEMSLVIKYLIDNNYTIYYMDTDSFFIDKPLPRLRKLFCLKVGLFDLTAVWDT